MGRDKPTNYWDYIKVEELLALQGGFEPTDKNLSERRGALHRRPPGLRAVVQARAPRARRRAAICSRRTRCRSRRWRGAVRWHPPHGAAPRPGGAHFEVMETMTHARLPGLPRQAHPRERLPVGAAAARSRSCSASTDGIAHPARPRAHYMQALRNHDGTPSPASRRVEARLADAPTLHDAVDELAVPHADRGLAPREARRRRGGGRLHRVATCAAHAKAAHDLMAMARAAGADEGGRARASRSATRRRSPAPGHSSARRTCEGERARACVAHPRRAGVHRELPRAAAARLAARGARRDGRAASRRS